MSMENAILDHAAALRELSVAIRESADATRQGNEGYKAAIVAYATASAPVGIPANDKPYPDSKPGAVEVKPDAEIEQAVQKVEADAKVTALPDDTAANTAEVEKQNAPADLEYAKDVRPVLLAAIKKAGKDTVAAMLSTFGVDKADKLTAEQLPAALAAAQKLAA